MNNLIWLFAVTGAGLYCYIKGLRYGAVKYFHKGWSAAEASIMERAKHHPDFDEDGCKEIFEKLVS